MHSPEVGDYMGVESCVDLRAELPPIPSHGGGGRSRRRPTAGKEFPPPIPPSHLAWVMKKYYSSDGRLVIMEEKVNRHERFRAHRSNGRLVLDLVPLDGGENTEVSGEETDGGDEGNGYPTVEDHQCYTYNGIGVRPCGGFAVATAAAFRPPVHT